MRDFFIGSFEKLVAVIVVLLTVVVVIGGISAMASQGFFAGLAILVGGALYVVMIGGILYLALGIYHNTMRTADAVEKLASR